MLFCCPIEQFDVRYTAGTPPHGKDNKLDTYKTDVDAKYGQTKSQAWSSISEIRGEMTTVTPFEMTAGSV